MSIDRIGKGGGGVAPPSTQEIGSTSPTQRSGQGFQVGGPKLQAGETAVTSAGSPALDRLRSGHITMSQYLDGRVEEATQHLKGSVSSDQLAFIRQSLREQLATDPTLVDLVKSATGSLPPATE